MYVKDSKQIKRKINTKTHGLPPKKNSFNATSSIFDASKF